MSSVRSQTMARLRESIPKDSFVRRVGGRFLRASRQARQAVKHEMHSFASRLVEVGTTPYSRWIRSHETEFPAYDGDRPITSFLLLVEGDETADIVIPRILLHERIEVEVVCIPENHWLEPELLRSYDLVLLLADSTVINRGALSFLALKHFQNPVAVATTFDSDLISKSGVRKSPIFRPEWSPDILLGNNYVGHAVAFTGKWLADIGGTKASGLGWWAALLDAALGEAEVVHLPNILISETSQRNLLPPTSEESEMVRERLAAHGILAQVTPEASSLVVDIASSQPPVSIIIPTRHTRSNMSRLVDSIRATDYPAFQVVVIDNGGQSDENAAWYAELFSEVDYRVEWWNETPFNYSRVNNHGARIASGEVLVFLNDDTEIVGADWLRLLVGHALRPGIGLVGFQMKEGTGLIQHGGVVLGPGGFADNLFAGLPPASATLIGPTTWHRNSLSVTGACAAVARINFDDVGGFDERFELMGSDVVLGLDQVLRQRRNLVLPFDRVRHYESLTRGNSVPEADLYASYWRYNPWLRNGDPYVSQNVSRNSPIPKFASTEEENPADMALIGLGRQVLKHSQDSNISDEAKGLLETASATFAQVNTLRASHLGRVGAYKVQTLNWFIPEIDMPFFGGLNTAFRMADKLRREHGVRNRFVVLGHEHELFYRSALDAAFEGLGANSDFVFYDGTEDSIAAIPRADAAISTLWLTATHVVKAMSAPRNFYLVQDFEPEFYPASTMFALAEESYRYGLYGICNTKSMRDTYVDAYNGDATYFVPAVDRRIYHPSAQAHKDAEVVTIFAYARDHFRNCWELVCEALTRIKAKHGRQVRIIVAGARYLPPTADFVDLGLMDYRATGNVYRGTDIGVTMQISRHPSYLPLELMACGVPMVSPDSEWFKWLFVDGENSKTVMRSLNDLEEKISSLVQNRGLRAHLRTGAASTIDQYHSDWDDALSGIYEYLCDPTRRD